MNKKNVGIALLVIGALIAGYNVYQFINFELPAKEEIIAEMQKQMEKQGTTGAMSEEDMVKYAEMGGKIGKYMLLGFVALGLIMVALGMNLYKKGVQALTQETI